MAEYRLTPKATADLRAIWHYIATDNETAADAVFSRLLDQLDLACQHPEMGMARPDLSATARILLVGAYVILYEPMPYGVLAVAIVHGMQHPQGWLD